MITPFNPQKTPGCFPLAMLPGCLPGMSINFDLGNIFPKSVILKNAFRFYITIFALFVHSAPFPNKSA
jgi:hypothetical protein